MQVIYYDVIPIMPLGSARQVDTLPDLLSQADFVSLHVPELPETKNMIKAHELSLMKDGAYLINNARGTVVDLEALAAALESGKLAGAAVDVFPKEPGSNGPSFNDNLNPSFSSRIQNAPNTILTPHIGGSTEEAQRMIGAEVSTALSRYLTYGTTLGAVNFPEVDLRAIAAEDERHIRVCHVHRNEPGVLRAVNEIFAKSVSIPIYLLSLSRHADGARSFGYTQPQRRKVLLRLQGRYRLPDGRHIGCFRGRGSVDPHRYPKHQGQHCHSTAL